MDDWYSNDYVIYRYQKPYLGRTVIQSIIFDLIRDKVNLHANNELTKISNKKADPFK